MLTNTTFNNTIMETIAIQTESANLSEEQFFRLCVDNKDLRIERDKNNNIIIMSPTGFRVSNFEAKVFNKLMAWNEKYNLGYVTGPSGGYNLPDGAMRAPDVAWTKKERIDSLTEKEKDKFPCLCPDFIIEIRSKTDSLKHTKEKMTEWITNGCQLAWLIDIENKISYIYSINNQTKEQDFNSPLSGENILPDFKTVNWFGCSLFKPVQVICTK